MGGITDSRYSRERCTLSSEKVTPKEHSFHSLAQSRKLTLNFQQNIVLCFVRQ
jgi:hypothetical protein